MKVVLLESAISQIANTLTALIALGGFVALLIDYRRAG